MKLFKVSVQHKCKWRKERKCFYEVSETKEAAREEVEKYLNTDYEVSHVSELGDQLAVYIYACNLKS